MSNYMLQDLVSVLAGFGLFGMLVVPLGALICWAINVAEFRSQPLSIRVLLAVVMGIAVAPVVAYLSARAFSFTGSWVLFASIWLRAGLIGVRAKAWTGFKRPFFASKHQKLFVAAVGLWILLGIFSLIDIQIGSKLYYPVESYDHSLRSSFTRAITRTGVPPENPYYRPYQPVKLRYHYMWLVVCSLTDQLGGAFVDARQALHAGTVWAGVGLICAIPLYVYFFFGASNGEFWKKALIGVSLLLVTGLDLIPTIVIYRWRRAFFPEMEWWNDQIPAWLGATLWVPHHIAALTAVLMGFLIVWTAEPKARLRQILPVCAAAGAAFASAAGCSVYVTLAFVLFCAVWLLVCWMRGFPGIRTLLMAGLFAALFALPYLVELAGQTGNGEQFARFSVRRFTMAEWILTAVQQEKTWIAQIVYLALLPVNYFLELGFFLVLGIAYWKRARSRPFTDGEWALSTLLLTTMVLCTFFRSGVIENNDLGWRGIALAQFVLLLWAAEHLWSNARVSRFTYALLVLGIAGTLYEVSIIRVYPILADAGKVRLVEWMSPDRKLGERTFAARQAYSELEQVLPEARTAQHNPMGNYDDVFSGLYSTKPAIAQNHINCGSVFGGSRLLCPEVIAPFEKIFQRPGSMKFSEVQKSCILFSADVLTTKDTDPAWKDHESWVWTARPLVINNFFRFFDCQGKNALMPNQTALSMVSAHLDSQNETASR